MNFYAYFAPWMPISAISCQVRQRAHLNEFPLNFAQHIQNCRILHYFTVLALVNLRQCQVET